MIDIRDLSGVQHHELVACFLGAFEGYFVQMPADPAYYRRRWEEERVDLSVSFGAFAEGKLVGFMLHGVDERSGKLAAHNAATGVLPEYRGKGLVGRMYGSALPQLQRRGVQKLTLEVICENASAIRAYEKAGFRIDRTLHCFIGPLPREGDPDIHFERKPIIPAEWEAMDQALVSWGNHAHCFSEDNAELYKVQRGTQPIGWFVMNKGHDRIYQFEVTGPGEGGFDGVFQAMGRIARGDIKIINVDSREKAKLAAIRRTGIRNYIDQYEMLYPIG